MGLLLLLLCIAGVWLLVHRSRRSVRTDDGGTVPARSRAVPQRASRPPDPEPDWQSEHPPLGEFVQLSTNGRLGIVGEAYRDKALRQVVRRRRAGIVGDWEAGLVEVAILEREPNNPYDGAAVRVRMRAGGTWVVVGYIPRASGTVCWTICPPGVPRRSARRWSTAVATGAGTRSCSTCRIRSSRFQVMRCHRERCDWMRSARAP